MGNEEYLNSEAEYSWGRQSPNAYAMKGELVDLVEDPYIMIDLYQVAFL